MEINIGEALHCISLALCGTGIADAAANENRLTASSTAKRWGWCGQATSAVAAWRGEVQARPPTWLSARPP
jgi:hypothetical protein